jgi:hypothetical protein
MLSVEFLYFIGKIDLRNIKRESWNFSRDEKPQKTFCEITAEWRGESVWVWGVFFMVGVGWVTSRILWLVEYYN